MKKTVKDAAHDKRVATVLEDLQVQLAAGEKAQVAKLEQSRDHLVSQLRTAAEKYLTVNGYMQARGTIEGATFGNPNQDGAEDFNALACEIAKEMSELAADMAAQFEVIDVMYLNESILEDVLEMDFVVKRPDPDLVDVVRQMLIVNLLQNVGPSINDIVSFREGTSDELEKIRAAIADPAGLVETATKLSVVK